MGIGDACVTYSGITQFPEVPVLMKAGLVAPLALMAGLVLLSCAHADDAPVMAASSSYESFSYPAERAFDGDMTTRWASAGVPGVQWWQIDFGKPIPINALSIHWERAYSVEYQVQLSDNGRDWRTVYERKDGKDEVTTIQGIKAHARFLRIYSTRNGPWPDISIWEIDSPDPVTEAAFKDAIRAAAEQRAAAALEAGKRAQGALQAAGCKEIVFAVRWPGYDGHWYANFSYYAAGTDQVCYHVGSGQLCVLNVATGAVRVLLDDPKGSVRDPQVSYDGNRIVFSYLKAGDTHFHLYDINADGTGLRQLTTGDYDDLEPTYLPDGGILFCSSRCKRWVNCWLTQVANLFRCDADGGNIRELSANIEQDNTPWVMPDGRLLYTRWEYVDRSQVDYHHLWTMNPDGTAQMVFYGNLRPSTVMIDAKPVPGTNQVVTIFSPGHGKTDHAGYLVTVDPDSGPDDPGAFQTLAPGDNYRDPYALGDGYFIAANGPELDVIGPDGQQGMLYHLPDSQINAGLWLHEPRPLMPRAREPVIQPRVDLAKPTGRLLLLNVYQGRNMAGVKPGDIAKLLVMETLPKPINYTGGMDPLTYGGSFTLERVVGTVPVAADGSAYMELPALRSLFFVALDKDDNTVKRMQSFTMVEPGEFTSCVGCHEQRTQAPFPREPALAEKGGPMRPAPVEGVPDVFDFPRDIQPVLDRNCVSCHGYDAGEGGHGPASGGVILTGDRGPMFSHSYYTLTMAQQFSDGRNQAVSNRAPRTIGAVASPIMKKLSGSHHGVVASAQDIKMVRYWIEAGAPYPGTYGSLGSGMIGGYYANGLIDNDNDWAETKAAAEVIDRRCASCHPGDMTLPRSLSDEREVSFWAPDWNDPRLKIARHIVFNLTRPEKSMMLLAPLAVEAGGWGRCKARDASQPQGPVFASKDGPDYRKLLALIDAGRRRLEEIKRFDMPGFRPPAPYLREMVRYGVLDHTPAAGEAVDAYALDRAYWKSLWWVPSGVAGSTGH